MNDPHQLVETSKARETLPRTDVLRDSGEQLIEYFANSPRKIPQKVATTPVKSPLCCCVPKIPQKSVYFQSNSKLQPKPVEFLFERRFVFIFIFKIKFLHNFKTTTKVQLEKRACV